MKRANVLGAALVVAGAVATAAPAAAQATVGADLGLFSAYVWRGLSLTNKPVSQPDVYVTFPAGQASFTVGGWANIEPGKYDGPERHQRERRRCRASTSPSSTRGPSSTTRIRRRSSRCGATGYYLPQRRRPHQAFNTVEIYGKVALSVPLSPKLAIWYDVDKIKGAYFEGSISHTFSRRTRSSRWAWARSRAWTPARASRTIRNSDQSSTSRTTGSPTSICPPPCRSLPAPCPSLRPSTSSSPVMTHQVHQVHRPPGLNSKDVKVWFGGTISWSKALGEAPAEEESGTSE